MKKVDRPSDKPCSFISSLRTGGVPGVAGGEWGATRWLVLVPRIEASGERGGDPAAFWVSLLALSR